MSIALEVRPLIPGRDGNKITFFLDIVAGGGTVSISVTPSDFNRFHVNVQVDQTGGGLNVGSWADVAAAINADPDASLLVTATGDPFGTAANANGEQDTAYSGRGVPTYYGTTGNNNYVNCGGELVNAGLFVAVGN